MSGFTISASEYQAMIARRDIRIAELESRLAKYEQPDDAEPVTWEFLLGLGFRHDDETIESPTSGFDDWVLYLHDDNDRVEIRLYRDTTLTNDCWINSRGIIAAPQTRGQVRRLIAALRGEP